MTRPNPSEKDSTVTPNQSERRGRGSLKSPFLKSPCDSRSSVLFRETRRNKAEFEFWVKWYTAQLKAFAYSRSSANVMRTLLRMALEIDTDNPSVQTKKNRKAE